MHGPARHALAGGGLEQSPLTECEYESPVTTKVKYTIPVARVRSI